MRPFLGDAPAFDDRDTVGERDRRRAVGDHERRAARHHLGQRGADLVLLRRVDRRGRVVEDQHLRVGEDGARDRDPLPLAAREREAALAEHRLVPLRQALDELRGAGEPRGAADLLVVGVGDREADVAADGVAEQERLLEHEPDAAP